MADELERFIKDNRDSFDDKIPSENVWKRIAGRLPIKGQTIWWKVAAVFFFCTTAFLFSNNFNKSEITSNELAELEDYYFTQIDFKRSLVNEIDHNNKYIDGMDKDLQNLDAMYMVLKEEWKKKPSKQVLEALTLNLLVRLDLLNRHLAALDEGRKKQDERNI